MIVHPLLIFCCYQSKSYYSSLSYFDVVSGVDWLGFHGARERMIGGYFCQTITVSHPSHRERILHFNAGQHDIAPRRREILLS